MTLASVYPGLCLLGTVLPYWRHAVPRDGAPPMRRMLTRCLGALLAILPATAAAQTDTSNHAFAIGARARWFVLGGEDFRLIDDAAGVEGDATLRIADPFHVALGAHYSSHGTFIDANLRVVAVFVEPRWSFGAGTVLAYLGLRGAWVHRSITPSTVSVSSSGFGFGAHGGVLRRLAGRLYAEGAMTFDFVSLANLLGGTERDDGSVLGLQAGLRVTVP